MRPLSQTSTKIIQAALPLFVCQGYHGTSLKDLMQKVEITKAAFYSHFDSKGQLLLRIIYDYEAKYIDQLIQIVNEYQGNAIGKLNRAISFSAKFAIKNLDLCLFLDSLTSELNGDENFLPSLKKVYDKYQRFVSDTIALGIEEGVINSDLDPDLAALIYVGAHNGVLHQWRLNRYQCDGGKYVKTFRKILMDGLKIGSF
jgi:AcrR family transcriptional regulator